MSKPNSQPVTVILPAYNEESAIAGQIEAVRKALSASGIEFEILVVDDGSSDQTVEEALKARARIIRHQENRGYGAALKTGIMAARHQTIAILDADGTYPADELPNLLARLDTADMVVGARTGDNVHIPWLRRPAKKVLGWLANRIAARKIPDLNSGLRVFRRDCVRQYFSILSNRFSFTTTVTLALLADDYRVVYHPIDYHQRIGQSKIVPRHFLDFVILVLRMAMLFQPLRVFVPLAVACGGLGLLKVIFDIITLFPRSAEQIDISLLYQPVLSTSAVLLLLVALQLLLIGMVSDAVLRRIALQNPLMVPSCGITPIESGLEMRKTQTSAAAAESESRKLQS